jgi:hypothetical protein
VRGQDAGGVLVRATGEPYYAGDVIGCGLLCTAGVGRVFFTKNGRLVAVLPEAWSCGPAPRLHQAVGLSAAAPAASVNFGLLPFAYARRDAFRSLGPGGAPSAAALEGAAGSLLGGNGPTALALPLARHARALLLSGDLPSVLLALRLASVMLRLDGQSQRILKRQDILERVAALAHGDVPRRLGKSADVAAVLSGLASELMQTACEVATARPPSAPPVGQPPDFAPLAARLRAGEVAALEELLRLLAEPDGVTEYEFEVADLQVGFSRMVASEIGVSIILVNLVWSG